MITPQIKAQVIAQLKFNRAPEELAEAFNLPVKLIKEWAGSLNPKELVALEANIYAVDTIAKKELTEDKIKKLKSKMEETAWQLSQEIYNEAIGIRDPLAAKSLQLLADALSKLYATIILKGSNQSDNDIPLNPNGISTFEQLMKD